MVRAAPGGRIRLRGAGTADSRIYLTGSVAAMAYGEPRLTNDIDIVVEIGERHVKNLLAAFPAADFYISEDAIREAIRNNGQFYIIHPESGIKERSAVACNPGFRQEF